MTSRLIGIARHYWASFDGMMASQGVDPVELPPDRFLSLVYWWATRNADDQAEIDKFDRKVWQPPKGVAAPAGSPWSAEAETQAFAAFSAEFQAMAGGA